MKPERFEEVLAEAQANSKGAERAARVSKKMNGGVDSVIECGDCGGRAVAEDIWDPYSCTICDWKSDVCSGEHTNDAA